VDAVLARNGAAPVVYIGDDRTDEDAFRALRGRGDGVIVADPAPAESAADAWVRSPAEVATVIAGLARAG
jgi:trehalose 6-phosphate phosphatase